MFLYVVNEELEEDVIINTDSIEAAYDTSYDPRARIIMNSGKSLLLKYTLPELFDVLASKNLAVEKA